MQLHQLRLVTSSGTSTYTFRAGVNVVTGSYKTGKSSMLELMKFVLGGNAQIMPAIERNLQAASLDLTIGNSRLTITRVMGQNTLTVNDSDGVVERWTATQGSLPRAGIKYLELLDIPVVRLSKKNDTGSEPLTFFDVMRMIYLPQSDVNRAVAGHTDTFVNRKRKAAFELVYGLADNRTRELEVEFTDLEKRRDRSRVAADAVRHFLVEVGAPGEDELAPEEIRLRRDLAEADDRLQAARENASFSVIGDQKPLRDRISELRVLAGDFEAERTAAYAAVESGKSVLAQLDVDERQLQRETFAAQSISGLEFSVCPRCLQGLDHREVEPGHCLLCTQAQPIVKRKDADQTLRRIKNQREEAQSLLAEDSQRLAYINQRLEDLRLQLDDAAGELERQADSERLFPSIDLASVAAGDRERARARLRDIERFRDQWGHHERQELEVSRYQRRVDENRAEQIRHRQELEDRRQRIDVLGEIFDEEIRELRFTGYEHANIDTQSYLPAINDDPFDKLSVSGASKTLANVAYYLANAGYSNSDSDFLLPGLLILDSPRTSLGDTPDDLAAGQRIYHRIDILAMAYPNLQIIVADNGLPQLHADVRRRINLIELTIQRPLLQNVPHPGREAAELQEAQAASSRRSSKRSRTG
ncbi:hypothetical protein [Pseudofrankia sp. BMG5.36]|uniref:hypothetical protein n=1 Tax=Pseudofrankia sp. BMG5.36 TaxID=1834512 RepID=UPI001042737F|nr:hypothetical protein [Pseudofrankia sp. BMG5.36]